MNELTESEAEELEKKMADKYPNCDRVRAFTPTGTIDVTFDPERSGEEDYIVAFDYHAPEGYHLGTVSHSETMLQISFEKE